MLEHPDLYQRYLLQVCELTTAFFNEDYMFGRIDAAAVLVAPYVYADANKMYSNADFDTNIEADLGGGGGGMGGGAILGLKPFVSNRTASVAGQIDCAAFVGLEETEWNGALYPNPVSSELHISWEGAMDVAVVFRNVLGQALKKVVLHHADRAVIPMAGWTPGTYVVSLEHDGVALTRQQIVVQ